MVVILFSTIRPRTEPSDDGKEIGDPVDEGKSKI
jgi:hypothetical protein